jgi:hypothetical protein
LNFPKYTFVNSVATLTQKAIARIRESPAMLGLPIPNASRTKENRTRRTVNKALRATETTSEGWGGNLRRL